MFKYDLPRTKVHPESVFTCGSIELWWDYNGPSVQNVAQNKPDIVYCNKGTKEAWIIDISVLLDVNVTRKHQEKIDNYMPLASELQRIYRDYKIRVVPIIVGALGVITTELKKGLMEMGVDNVGECSKQIQRRSLIGSMKIAKTFMRM